MSNLVCIKICNTKLETEIVKGFLEANGITTSISADDEGGMAPFPFQPSGTGVRLLVSRKDADKAREILERYTAEILEMKKRKGG